MYATAVMFKVCAVAELVTLLIMKRLPIDVCM
jgi:hypothetical protein